MTDKDEISVSELAFSGSFLQPLLWTLLLAVPVIANGEFKKQKRLGNDFSLS